MANFILAVDLAWKQSGWAILNDSDPEMLVRCGHFVANRHEKSEDEIFDTAYQIFDYFYNMSASLLNATTSKGHRLHVCYEITDWHQSLDNGDARLYARERNAQRLLGRAEAAFALGVNAGSAIVPVPLGAVEVKRRFGASKKEEIALLLAAEWPNKITRNGGDYYFDGIKLTDGMTDAMAIGHVYLDNLRMKNIIERG